MGRREGAEYQMTSIMVWVGLFFLRSIAVATV